MFGAPGRTRTGSLLFRRCLSPDAVLESEVAGRQRATDESYQVSGPSRFVTLSSEKALSGYRGISNVPSMYRRRPLTAWPAVIRAVPPCWVLRRPLAYPSTAMPGCEAPLVAPSGSGVAAPQGALRAMGSSACRRVLAGLRLVPPPAATSAESGATHRVQRPYPPWSCVASTRCSESRLEIELSSSWSTCVGTADTVPDQWYISDQMRRTMLLTCQGFTDRTA